MHLHAVIVPPPDVVDDARAAAHQLFASAPTDTEARSRGRFGRLFGRHAAAPPAAPVATLMLSAPEAVFVSLAKFGNVAGGDATALAAALEAGVAAGRVPILHVSTMSVSQAAPFHVAAELDGDLDALREMFRNVHEVARLERFFLDRRTFSHELRLGKVATAVGSPGDVVGTSVEHRGRPWSPTHITLMRATLTGNEVTFAEFARVELPDASEDLGAASGALA